MPITKRPNSLYQDKILMPLDIVAAVAATTTLPLGTMDGAYRVEKFEIEALGGYTADATNYYVITLQAGATVLATYSLLTGQQGSLTTLVFGNAVLAATPVGAQGDRLDVVFTKVAAAANFPASSRLVAHVKQLQYV